MFVLREVKQRNDVLLRFQKMAFSHSLGQKRALEILVKYQLIKIHLSTNYCNGNFAKYITVK